MVNDSMWDDTGAALTIAPAVRTAAGPVNGTAVDTGEGGDHYRNVLFVVVVGTITDATHAVTFQGSDDGTTGWVALDAAQIQGTVPVLAPANSNRTYRVAWDGGNKRFVRAVLTIGGTPTAGGAVAVIAVMRGRGTPRGLPA